MAIGRKSRRRMKGRIQETELPGTLLPASLGMSVTVSNLDDLPKVVAVASFLCAKFDKSNLEPHREEILGETSFCLNQVDTKYHRYHETSLVFASDQGP